MPVTQSKKQLGVRGEDLACAELERQGMQVLERNWRCRLGEPVMLRLAPVPDSMPACRRNGSHKRPRTQPACTRDCLTSPTKRSTSLESQERELRALAAQHGLTVVAVHVDPGFSGALRDRPGFLAWLDDAKKARCDHLLAHHLDRVSRGSLAGIAVFMDVIEGLGPDGKPSHEPPRFLSVDDRLDSQSAGWDMEVGMRGIFAREERRRISDRVKRAKRAIKAQGDSPAESPPFGWTSVDNPNGNGRVLAPVEEEQEALRGAAKVLIKDGLKASAKYMNQTGLTPRRAKAFTRQTMMQTLTSEASSEIFTPVERVRIKEALKPKEERKKHGRNATRLLAGGILRCAGCDRPMYVAYACRTPEGPECGANQALPLPLCARRVPVRYEGERQCAIG